MPSTSIPIPSSMVGPDRAHPARCQRRAAGENLLLLVFRSSLCDRTDTSSRVLWQRRNRGDPVGLRAVSDAHPGGDGCRGIASQRIHRIDDHTRHQPWTGSQPTPGLFHAGRTMNFASNPRAAAYTRSEGLCSSRHVTRWSRLCYTSARRLKVTRFGSDGPDGNRGPSEGPQRPEFGKRNPSRKERA